MLSDFDDMVRRTRDDFARGAGALPSYPLNLSPDSFTPPTIAAVKDAVCREFGITRLQIDGDRRMPAVARPRQVVMYLGSKLTGKSYGVLGAALGNRDTSTIMHGVRVIAAEIAADPSFAARVQRVAARLQGSSW